MRAHDERNRGLGMTKSSPLRFLALAKVSEMTILHPHFLKAVEDLRAAVVMAGSTTQALEKRMVPLGPWRPSLLSQNHRHHVGWWDLWLCYLTN